MDAIVDSIEKAYGEFLTATAILLETREANAGKKPDGVDPNLESLQKHLLSFRHTCDEAQVFVDKLKHSLGLEEFPANVPYSPELISDFDCDLIPVTTDD